MSQNTSSTAWPKLVAKMPSNAGPPAIQTHERAEKKSPWYGKRKWRGTVMAALILSLTIAATVPALVLEAKQRDAAGKDDKQHVSTSRVISTTTSQRVFTGTANTTISTSTDIRYDMTQSMWASIKSSAAASSSSLSGPSSVLVTQSQSPPSASINQSHDSSFISTVVVNPIPSGEPLNSSSAVSSAVGFSSGPLASTPTQEATTTSSVAASATIDAHFFTSLISQLSIPFTATESKPGSSPTSGGGVAAADPRFTTSTVTVFAIPAPKKESSTVDSNVVTGTSATSTSLALFETTLWPTYATAMPGAVPTLAPSTSNPREASAAVSAKFEARDGKESRCLSVYQDDMNQLAAQFG